MTVATAAPLRAALLLAALLGPGVAGALGPLAARVNDAGISRQRLDRFAEEVMAGQGRSAAGIQSPQVYRRFIKEALDQLIDDELIGQEALRRGLVPAAEAVEQALEAERRRSGAPVQFELRLERSGFDEAGLRAHLSRQLSVARLVERDFAAGAAVSDAEVHDWYLAHGAATGRTEREAGASIRIRLRQQRLEAAVWALLVDLRRAATVEIFVPVEARP